MGHIKWVFTMENQVFLFLSFCFFLNKVCWSTPGKSSFVVDLNRKNKYLFLWRNKAYKKGSKSEIYHLYCTAIHCFAWAESREVKGIEEEAGLSKCQIPVVGLCSILVSIMMLSREWHIEAKENIIYLPTLSKAALRMALIGPLSWKLVESLWHIVVGLWTQQNITSEICVIPFVAYQFF